MKWFWILGVFLYVVVSGLFMQCVLLPYVFSAQDNGVGLIRNSDAEGFHYIAKIQAETIRRHGWSAWGLRPEGQSPAGIASAMYVLMGTSKPWAMLPVNAVVWAFSAWMLVLILRPLAGTDVRAALCALPFVLAPSSLLFLTQIHKDPFIITGTLVVWFALTRLVACRMAPLPWSEAGRNLAWMTGGVILLWVGRPYAMFLSVFGCVCVAVVLLVVDLVQWRTNLAVWSVVIVSAMIAFGLARTKDAQEYSEVGLNAPSEVSSMVSSVETSVVTRTAFVFRPSCLGPLDEPFMRMAAMRAIYLESYPEAQRKLDEYVTLDSAWSVMGYIPRALQLLLLSPFPSTWICAARSNPFASLILMETMARYLLFPGLIWVCWQKRRVLEFWIPWLFFIPWALINVIITPNLGTLIRVRFSFVMILASLGAAGTVMFWKTWRDRKQCQ